MNRPLENRRALVTGASSGIGRAIASELCFGGSNVIATGRNAQRLESWRNQMIRRGVSPRHATIFTADLASSRDRERLLEEVDLHFEGELDLAVLCAGVGAYGRFLSHDAAILREVFEINFFAIAELARGLYHTLVRGRNPALVAVGSIVARRALPGRSEYSASKFALAGFVDALRAEWSGDDIQILLVNPGFTRTDFEQNLLVDTAYLKTTKARTRSPESVAHALVRGLTKRKLEITVGSLGAHALLLVNRFAPRFVDYGLAWWTRRLYKKHEAVESGPRECHKPGGSPLG
jgi:short-subunit dehydrogenase